MRLAQIVGISYAIVAVATALAVTILQVHPALFFIKMLVIDGKFPATVVFLLTALLLLIPGIAGFMLISYIRRSKNAIPDLTGKTGIILLRKRALYNAIYNFHVLVDGNKVGSIGNGQSLFVELTKGHHKIEIRNFKSSIYEFDLKFGNILKLVTQVKEQGIKAEVIIIPSSDIEM